MKKFLIVTLISTAIFTGCDRSQQSHVPVINFSDGNTVTVPTAGGTVSIDYDIINPAQEAKITVVTDDSGWIKSVNSDHSGTIQLDVSANNSGNVRSATVTLIYAYNNNEVTTGITIIQTAADFYLDATVFSGVYSGQSRGNNGEYSYYTWLSDKPFDNQGLTQPGGTYYVLDIFTSAAPNNPSKPLPPVGTYKLGKSGETSDMTFGKDNTFGMTLSEDGSERTMDVTFTEGLLEISNNGSIYTFQAMLIDDNGQTHCITYSGPVSYIISEQGTADYILTEDLNITAIGASAYYDGREEDIMLMVLELIDMPVDENGMATPPGNIMTIDVYMPFSADGHLVPGTYPINSTPNCFEEGTTGPGVLENIFGNLLATGTYATHYDNTGFATFGFIKQGSMTLAGSPGAYTIDCQFTTNEGYTVNATHTGDIVIHSYSEPFSTLTEDYTLNLKDNVGYAYYYGDLWETGGTFWDIFIHGDFDNTNTDRLFLDIVSENVSLSDGIPSGTYSASLGESPKPGEYIPGYLINRYDLGGTLYLSGVGEDVPNMYAPAKSGDAVITNHGDGTYTISFEFIDDKGHTFNGEWSGILNLSGSSQEANSPMRSAQKSHNNELQTLKQ